jgi:hypothetical protein
MEHIIFVSNNYQTARSVAACVHRQYKINPTITESVGAKVVVTIDNNKDLTIEKLATIEAFAQGVYKVLLWTGTYINFA